MTCAIFFVKGPFKRIGLYRLGSDYRASSKIAGFRLGRNIGHLHKCGGMGGIETLYSDKYGVIIILIN
jgi:hypothetical protein